MAPASFCLQLGRGSSDSDAKLDRRTLAQARVFWRPSSDGLGTLRNLELLRCRATLTWWRGLSQSARARSSEHARIGLSPSTTSRWPGIGGGGVFRVTSPSNEFRQKNFRRASVCPTSRLSPKTLVQAEDRYLPWRQKSLTRHTRVVFVWACSRLPHTTISLIAYGH